MDQLKTGEHVGFWVRLAAFCIDMVLIYFVLDTIVSILLAFQILDTGAIYDLKDLKGNNVEDSRDLLNANYYYMLFAISILYFAIFHSSSWQATVGKVLVRIEVVDKDGFRLSFPIALIREIFKVFSKPLYLIQFSISYLIIPYLALYSH
jgi:uncharacterized RDD family membrane protein YckC